MAKRVKNTYTLSRLNRALQSIGFESNRLGNHIVFTHSSGRPVILLPEYKSGQALRPIHLMMIKKQLSDIGMLELGQFAVKTQVKRAIHSKS